MANNKQLSKEKTVQGSTPENEVEDEYFSVFIAWTLVEDIAPTLFGDYEEVLRNLREKCIDKTRCDKDTYKALGIDELLDQLPTYDYQKNETRLKWKACKAQLEVLYRQRLNARQEYVTESVTKALRDNVDATAIAVDVRMSLERSIMYVLDTSEILAQLNHLDEMISDKLDDEEEEDEAEDSD